MTRSVAYVLTHHPCVAQTFIRREMTELGRTGWTVVPIALNRPTAAELQHPGAVEAAAATCYVKSVGPLRALRAVGNAVRRSPVGMARLAASAARSGGTDLRRIVWRLLQLAEACIVWEQCRRKGVRHLHAHFAQATATVARFAAAIGSLTDPEPWTWSFTVHGMHDVVDEAAVELGSKVADASFVVCVCDWLRGQVLRVSDPAHWSKVVVIRCGVDLDELRARPPETARRDRLAALHVVCLGRLSPEKGQLVLVEALDRLHAAGRDVRLELIGGGPDAERLAGEIGRRGLDTTIHMTGELDPQVVAARLRAADVCCLPSFAEGIPVSMMEAMALGVAVVATHVGGVPELARDHCTALTVPPADPAALALAIGELVDHPELGERLAVAARRAVEQAHDSRRNVAQLAELFAGAAGVRGLP
jgi:colanic acid/amylovoran biosynthesis glycosyltransferase